MPTHDPSPPKDNPSKKRSRRVPTLPRDALVSHDRDARIESRLVRIETISQRLDDKLNTLIRLLREEPVGEAEFPDPHTGTH